MRQLTARVRTLERGASKARCPVCGAIPDPAGGRVQTSAPTTRPAPSWDALFPAEREEFGRLWDALVERAGGAEAVGPWGPCPSCGRYRSWGEKLYPLATDDELRRIRDLLRIACAGRNESDREGTAG